MGEKGRRGRRILVSSMKRLEGAGYDTDKLSVDHLRNYETYFAPLVDKEVKLLELGVLKGGSLLMWRDFFEKGTIVGLDLNPLSLEDQTGRIRVYQGFQDDTALLDRIARENAPEGFDVIIDDCSHIGEPTRISFWRLFRNHLKPGGIYAIEDWGTGYWDSWPDGKRYSPARHPSLYYRLASALARLMSGARGEGLGARWARELRRVGFQWIRFGCRPRQRFRSHDYGMVGFVKQLIDEAGMGDITDPKLGRGAHRPSLFRSIHVSHGHAIIVKSGGLVRDS